MITNDQLAPNIFVIFGGAGDLTWRKLMPALFDLSRSNRIPVHFSIILVDRVELSEEALCKRLHEGVRKFARSGKAAAKEWKGFSKNVQYLRGDFKGQAVPHQAFPVEATLEWQPARLIMSIQPDEGIVLRFQAKRPGPDMVSQPVDMRFNYRKSFATLSPEAYVTLLSDVIDNDATLFMRADQVEVAWRLLMPVLDAWKASPANDFPNYAGGTWGPDATQGLLVQQGHGWLAPMDLTGVSK